VLVVAEKQPLFWMFSKQELELDEVPQQVESVVE
jgi:hypothetical protein